MKTYKYKVQGVDYEVEIVEVEGKIARVNVNGIPFEIEMQKPSMPPSTPYWQPRRELHPLPPQRHLLMPLQHQSPQHLSHNRQHNPLLPLERAMP